MGSLGVVQAEALAATGGEKPAVDQYESDYFDAKLALAQFDTDEVYLLTPENGFVELDETVPPDTFTFHEREIGEQARWALEVVEELIAVTRRNDYDNVAVYAEVTMRRRLKKRANLQSRLRAAGARLLEPTAGLGDRDRQLDWLDEQLRIRRHAEAEGHGDLEFRG